jgi:hypothetical protein
MADETTKPDVEQLTKRDFLISVLHGIAVTLGLALLWFMEAVRDRFFRLLERWHVPTMPWRKASAFPPGPIRRRA